LIEEKLTGAIRCFYDEHFNRSISSANLQFPALLRTSDNDTISKPTPSAFADSLTFFGGADRSPLKLLRLRAILFGDELVLTFEYEIPEQET
jgi:hypothetical protein